MSKRGRVWLQHQATVWWKTMQMARPLPQACRTCPSHTFEMRAFQVLNTGGQSVLASCEETSLRSCPPKRQIKALSSLHTVKFLQLSQMPHVCWAMIYNWMHTLRPPQLQSKMDEFNITTKWNGKVEPNHFKIFPQKRKARNGWIVTECFSGNETGLWEKAVHQHVFGQFCQNRLWQKMFCVFFTQRQMKETNLWLSDTSVCLITSNDLFAPSGKNLKGLLCDRK